MLTPDIYDMVLTIAGHAVPDIHLDRKLRATLLAADETPRPEIAYVLSDELAMHPGLPDGCHVPQIALGGSSHRDSAWPGGKRSSTAWIVHFEQPATMARRTNSRSFSDSTSPRTMRAARG
jgi:hypothetical protein